VLDEPEEEAIEEKPFTAKQGKQVYRFHARRGKKQFVIEAQGKNTLGDLDAVMREAFGHDPLTTLASLRSSRRAAGQAVGPPALGPARPTGRICRASGSPGRLGLEPGAQLEYVYDFGDNLEHALVLEAIEEPEKGAEYPRFFEAWSVKMAKVVRARHVTPLRQIEIKTG